MFDNLNKELATKDSALVEGEARLTEKERELKKYKTQLRVMDDNM